jgi:cytochrome P450 PksS
LDLSIVADFLRIASRMMALQDMPQHTRLRKMASERFTRRALETLRPAVQQVADVLLTACNCNIGWISSRISRSPCPPW